MKIPPFARLPIAFDAPALLAEVADIDAQRWVVHFNTGYHDGGWHGVALRSAGGDAARLHSDPSGAVAPSDTEMMARCPNIAAALARIECPLRAVRVLRLAAGSVIREHRDDDLRFEDGEARLHIPLATNPGVEFYVDDARVIMEPGECWYLDLSRPHRVANRGSTERIHLVIDCQVNDWLAGQVAASRSVERAPVAASAQQRFVAFRERVFEDETLQEQLRALDDATAFVAKAVELGSAHGFEFGAEEVRSAMTRGRQSWWSQWVL